MAAKTVNIRKDVTDKFYRYKMPELLTKIEGKGNGIKTVLPNISEVARALSRPPTYPTKFFGCELGAQTMFDDKADRYIVNGAHDAARLRDLLVTFIDKFVLCPACKNPETDLILTKDDIVLRDCKACGERRPVDMRHKLITFIVKNPPQPKAKKGKKGAAVPTDANGENGEAAANGNGADHGTEDGGSDDELTRRIKEGAKQMEEAESKQPEKDNVEWSADTSESAVASRLEALSGGIQSSLLLDDEDGDDDKVYKDFSKWLIENRSATDAQIYKHAADKNIEKKHKTVQYLFGGLFTEDVEKEVVQRKVLLNKMVTSEKYVKAFLGGFEIFFGVTHPDLISRVPKVLMACYQSDILDEETIKNFGSHASKKFVDIQISRQVRKAAKPLIVWFDEAEDESD